MTSYGQASTVARRFSAGDYTLGHDRHAAPPARHSRAGAVTPAHRAATLTSRRPDWTFSCVACRAAPNGPTTLAAS